uniref:murein biosynthesis integral membrane protein MurJ n=1 Tax=Candidatus Albibeggiatoa sp. nov. BB20 TaxID=3162723 RepID=UPI003365A0F1
MLNKLLKSTAIVGGVTMISRIFGFIRDVVIAHTFGAGVATDAFLVAFKIPNFMRRLFAEGAFSQAFTPVLSEYKTQRNKEEVHDLVNHVAGSLGGLLAIITILGILCAPLLIIIFAPGFINQPDKYQLTSDMLMLTFPYLFFIALTAFAGSVLNTYGKFAIPAFTPVLLNICMIGATLFLAPYFEQPVMALAWGVLIAGVVQLCFQIPFLYRLGLVPRPKFNLKHEGVARIHRLMLPALFGVSVSQINLLFDTLLASFLVTGSVSWLYYSDRLMEFPVGVFGLALATVILPNLSKLVAENDNEAFEATLDWALRWVFLIGVPCTFGLAILSAPTLTTLFYGGEFTEHDIARASHSLIAYSVGLTGFVLIKVLASGFYSRQDTKTPVKVAVVSMVSNMVMNMAFIYHLQHVGLALATSIAALINASLLYYYLRQQNVFTPLDGWRNFLLRISASAILMATILAWGSGSLEQWIAMSLYERVTQLFLW